MSVSYTHLDVYKRQDLYNERVPYYEKYADIVIDEEGMTPGDTVDVLREILEEKIRLEQ